MTVTERKLFEIEADAKTDEQKKKEIMARYVVKKFRRNLIVNLNNCKMKRKHYCRRIKKQNFLYQL